MSAASVLFPLCLLLLLALAWTLRELYARELDRARKPFGREAPSDPRESVEDLLTMLLAIQEYGISQNGPIPKEEFCAFLLEHACRLLQCHEGFVGLAEEGKLVQAASRRASGAPNERALAARELAARAFEAGRLLLSSSPQQGQGMALALPFSIKGRAVGALSLQGIPRPLGPEDLRTRCLALLCGEAAALLEHQQRYDDLQTYYLEMVQTLAQTVDSRDSYSQGHAERSRRWARELARELGLPEQTARYVEFATMLQGVGKIGIDQAILSKPGKLTQAEFEEIKKHPSIAYRLLAPVKFLGPVAQMVLYHQEWFNGKGYPQGLSGEEIPLGSRIVAVINAWEAMNADRPYRKRLPREEALEQLQKGAGAQFDPKVVEAFLRVEARQVQAAQA